MKRLFLVMRHLLGYIVVCFLLIGCGSESDFKDRLQPVPENSGFRMDDYFVWCGSVIEVDGLFHMFASRWPKQTGFPEGYRRYSEIVRATADHPEGPYTFQEIIIGKRDSVYWDACMAHNPTVHKIDNQYVLFYIGSDFTTLRSGTSLLLRRVGYATADSIEGPWTRCDAPIIDEESNNPAIYLESDMRVKMLYRDADLKVIMAEAPSFKGPYATVNDNVWPECRLEDFYLFKMHGLYRFICEDNVGGISGHERWGVELISDNGIDGWRKADPAVVYDHAIKYTSGRILHCTRRERPQLLICNGKITHLITSVFDGKDAWSQPVEIKPPIDIR